MALCVLVFVCIKEKTLLTLDSAVTLILADESAKHLHATVEPQVSWDQTSINHISETLYK